MGIMLNKNDQNDDELSRRINADLRERAAAGLDGGEAVEGAEAPDLAEDAEYVKNFKKTNRFGWVWIVLIVLAIAALVSIAMV